MIVPRNRKVEQARRRGVALRWRDLPDDDVEGELVTGKVRTVIDCARDLPFPESLAVADSALRDGVVHDDLIHAAERIATRGRAKALRVALAADARAANPFESVLRGLAIESGLSCEPQLEIADRGLFARPDLVVVDRRLVIEADSFEFHGSRKALHRDCRRYTAMSLRGWTVIRFSWEDVFLHTDYVRECLATLVHGPEQRAILPDPGRLAA